MSSAFKLSPPTRAAVAATAQASLGSVSKLLLRRGCAAIIGSTFSSSSRCFTEPGEKPILWAKRRI